MSCLSSCSSCAGHTGIREDGPLVVLHNCCILGAHKLHKGKHVGQTLLGVKTRKQVVGADSLHAELGLRVRWFVEQPSVPVLAADCCCMQRQQLALTPPPAAGVKAFSGHFAA